MIAILGTLPFLATMWLLLVVGARLLEENGAKIVAALNGEPSTQPPAILSERRVRVRLQSQEVRREGRPLRAAA